MKIETEPDLSLSKPYQLWIYNLDDGKDETLVGYGCSYGVLELNFAEAEKEAKSRSRKDGKARYVEVRHVMKRTKIYPFLSIERTNG